MDFEEIIKLLLYVILFIIAIILIFSFISKAFNEFK